MIATRQDQENAVHRRQTAVNGKPEPVKAAALHKTPARQAPRTPFRGKQRDENAVSIRRADGKVKNAVATLEGKMAKATADASVERARIPLGTKTANVKGNAFQTPAQALTRQRPVFKNTSPRLRKAKFLVHEAEPAAAQPAEETREIEYMHPREEPLLDYADDDVWPHDRKYPQFEGSNFSKGWALEFFADSEEPDFDTRMKEFEVAEANKRSNMVDPTAPSTISSAKVASSISSVRGKASFAAATASSAARAMTRTTFRPSSTRPIVQRNARHAVAKMTSNTTIGYAKGRQASGAMTKHDENDLSPITEADRSEVLNAMWHTLSDDETTTGLAPIDILDLECLRDLNFGIPDD